MYRLTERRARQQQQHTLTAKKKKVNVRNCTEHHKSLGNVCDVLTGHWRNKEGKLPQGFFLLLLIFFSFYLFFFPAASYKSLTVSKWNKYKIPGTRNSVPAFRWCTAPPPLGLLYIHWASVIYIAALLFLFYFIFFYPQEEKRKRRLNIML